MPEARRWRGRALAAGGALLAATVCLFLVVRVETRPFGGPDVPRDRPVPALREGDRPLRVTVLGTSLSSPGRYRWPDDVAIRLAEQVGRRVEILRITQPGGTSTWGATQVDRVLATDPDVVLVELAVNDADVRRRVTVAASVASHERILAGIRAGAREPAVVLITMNPVSGPRGWMRPLLHRYYAEYAGLADRHHAGLVDLCPRWDALPARERDLPDGLHPSDAAASRVVVAPVVDVLARAARL